MLYHAPTGSANANAGYVGKNVEAGQQGSKVPPAAIEFPQREILAAQAAAGLAASDASLTQLAQAMSIGLFLGVAGGSANALTGTIPGGVTFPALIDGMTFHAIVGPNANTGTVTFNLSGFATVPGALSITRNDGVTPLAASDLKPGAVFSVKCIGGVFRFVGTTKSDNLAIVAASTRVNALSDLLAYVRSDGSGSDTTGDGTLAKPFATIGAPSERSSLYNLAGFQLVIQLGAPGSYIGYAVPNIGVSGSVIVQGDGSNQTGYNLTPVQLADGSYTCLGSAIPTVSAYGLTFDMSGVTVGAAVRAFSGGQITYGKVTFKYPGSSATVNMWQADAGGLVSRFDDVIVTGGGRVGAVSYVGGGVDAGCTYAGGRNLTISGMTFDAFYRVDGGRAADQYTTFIASANTGSQYNLTGPGYLVSANKAAIPGSLPGTEADGGRASGGTSWVAASLTIASQGGALGSAAAACRYKRDGKTITMSLSWSITDKGTGSASLAISLPTPTLSTISFGGREVGLTGKGVTASAAPGASALYIQFTDNTTCIASGASGAFVFSYEVA